METLAYKKVKEAKGLKVGSQAPDFSASDLNDNVFSLTSALEKGPVVLIFYRGQWCPFCNKHLKALEKNLEKIYEKGASVVAVSPEKSEFLKRTADKTKASFSLLYDEDYKIAEAFDVAFRPTKFERAIYNKILKTDLKNAHSDESQQLPIPATFIIGKDGKIIWRHFDPDYKKRSTVDDIVKNIPK
ncbi:peroxiredoxin-like family protein [Draconibacterium sediminis]|uniref:peroxiredoxin-like family protein n=1 Tax=Draconibacterium sediminis TaxID=1544798 RepID=UPI0026ECDCF7|nr:peroxiredoxin-like family protein [Draconibacterium sediminis]